MENTEKQTEKRVEKKIEEHTEEQTEEQTEERTEKSTEDKSEEKTGRVFNIQRYSVDDGCGIRTCVFLKGCPLACLWCHNIESQRFGPEIAFYTEKCIACGECMKVCERACHSLQAEHGLQQHCFNRTDCTVCGKCASVCPTEALEFTGKIMTVTEVMKTVRRDKPFYGKTGGMTVTGGEPMAQPDFTLALLQAAKSEGIGTSVETSGFGKDEDYLSILPYCDEILFDCKASSEDHSILTGVPDTQILHILELLYVNKAKIRLRCPIVSGANLTESYIEKVIQLATKYPAITAIELLPYHSAGIVKADRLGIHRQQRFETPNEDTLRSIKEKLLSKTTQNVYILHGTNG